MTRLKKVTELKTDWHEHQNYNEDDLEGKCSKNLKNLDVTEIRFRLVIAMLAIDDGLVKRVKAYLTWYH